MTERFVLIGVARSRERWFSELARWSNSGVAPIEFVKCLSSDEARAVLGAGRRASALLIDGRWPGIDRELVALAADHGVPTFAVSDGSVHRDWDALGCATVLNDQLDQDDLIDALIHHARPVERSPRPGRARIGEPDPPRTSRLVAAVGSGGVGTSTVVMALGQAVARVAARGSVVVVDGAARGELAMYHDVGDVIPGLPELVEAHRSDRLDPEEIRRMTFDIDGRGYRLLLGRRRPSDWVVLRHRAVDASFDGLLRSFGIVIADLDPDLDGERDTGSADVADRHAVTITGLALADLVLVVGRPGLKGVHSMSTLIREVIAVGVPPARILPVVNESPRSPATRIRLDRSILRLVDPGRDGTARVVDDEGAEPMRRPLHLRRVRRLDDTQQRCAAMPDELCTPLGQAVERLLRTAGPRGLEDTSAGARVRRGELGTSTDPTIRDGRRSDVA